MKTNITELAQLRAELSNPAVGSKDHLRKLALSLVEALEKSEKTSEARREAIDRTHNMFVRERDRANAAEEALEKAQQEAEELSKFKEVMTSAADALKAGKPLNLESLFKGELASAMFAMMFAGEFVRSGATNYLELLYDVPEFGEMTVTLQKVEGKTPGQRIDELESRTVKLPESIVDKVCLTAAEIHAQGSGVTDDKAQDIIDRIREILTPVAGFKVEAE